MTDYPNPNSSYYFFLCLKFQICMQKYIINIKLAKLLAQNLLFCKYFLDFGVGFGKFVLAELD